MALPDDVKRGTGVYKCIAILPINHPAVPLKAGQGIHHQTSPPLMGGDLSALVIGLIRLWWIKGG